MCFKYLPLHFNQVLIGHDWEALTTSYACWDAFETQKGLKWKAENTHTHNQIDSLQQREDIPYCGILLAKNPIFHYALQHRRDFIDLEKLTCCGLIGRPAADEWRGG